MKPSLPEVGGRRLQRLHCAGVGGMGLGPLAIYLAGLGFSVSGEDDALSEAMRLHLDRAGVRIGPMDRDCECLVYSSAIAATHPAAQAAARLGIPSLRRGECLAQIVAGRKLVAVCGAHGKSTTTAMLVFALRAAGLQPAYVLGGLFGDEQIPPAAVGEGDWVVAEIDESDGTIVHFSPEITVLTNLEWDHPDFYRTEEQLLRTFRELFARTRLAALTSAACPRSPAIAGSAPRDLVFGAGQGDYRYAIRSQTTEGLRLSLEGAYPISECLVHAHGDFNAANAAAALAAAHLMGVTLRSGLLAAYSPVRRRQSVIASSEPFLILEDYAHHPSEIRALLGSLRVRVGTGRLVVVFQPHRYSRTVQFLEGFVEALSLADEVHLLEVYSAGEKPLEGGHSSDLARRFPAARAALYHGEDSLACFEAASKGLQPGDLLAVVGAGDIDQRARAWLASRDWDRQAQALRTVLSPETKLTREEALAPRTTMRAGGAARLFAEPASEADLRALLLQAQSARLPLYFLGRGSNLLIPDSGVDGLVISLTHPNWSAFEIQADGSVRVGAGLRLKNLCGLAAKHGLCGFEFLEGIPGCIGGALRMNAGAMGGWTFDVVEEVELMRLDGRVERVPKLSMDVDYRHCGGLDQAIALGAILRPRSAADSTAISQQIEAYRAKRQSSQPREPSAGCIFKNPPGDSAGRLIDQCGLKGTRIGGAMVSPVHANFIVNVEKASASDIIALVRLVRARVHEQRGIDLEPEVLLFGKEWRSVL